MHRDSRDGHQDGLTPLKTLDLGDVEDIDELLAGMALTSLGAGIGEAAECWKAW